MNTKKRIYIDLVEIILLPKSLDSSFKPTVLRYDETVHLKVLGEFVRIIR